MEITRVSHPTFVYVTCPYCGTRNRIHISEIQSNKHVALCDIEDVPGCDEYFAFDIRIKYETAVYKMVQAGE
jgi:hypothetical protein